MGSYPISSLSFEVSMFKSLWAIALVTPFCFFGVNSIARSQQQDAPVLVAQVEQCDALIAVANQTVSQVEAINEKIGETDSLDALLQIADITETAAVQMQGLNLADAQLQDYRNQFVEMYFAASGASRALVNAVETEDISAAQQAYSAIVRATEQEAPLVNAVNAYCAR